MITCLHCTLFNISSSNCLVPRYLVDVGKLNYASLPTCVLEHLVKYEKLAFCKFFLSKINKSMNTLTELDMFLFFCQRKQTPKN